jgi:predicted RNA-binding Zn-ribbon protein involved in translation (DUF1610 family)
LVSTAIRVRFAVFQLFFDSGYNILLSRMSGTFVADDIELRDKAVSEFLKKNGPARGIMDFTAVDTVDIPMIKIVERCQAPPLLSGTPRVILAPTDLAWRFSKVIAAHQLYARKVAPLLVRSTSAAYRALGMGTPRFEPLPRHTGTLEETVRQVLARIDEAHGSLGRVNDERRRLRAKILRLMEADTSVSAERDQPLSFGRVHQQAGAITLSNILNAVLNHATLIDADLKTICPRCGVRLSLASCRVVAGRRTTYSCPACGKLLVTLASAAKSTTAQAPDSYLFGAFMVRTTTDIDCVGASLPRLRLDERAEPPEPL